MFVPTFDNDISVLVNHSLDLAEIVRFDALLLCENKLRAVPLELGHTSIPFNMNVKRVVLLAVEEERESKESEYFWHISFVILFICHKDRNYF